MVNVLIAGKEYPAGAGFAAAAAKSRNVVLTSDKVLSEEDQGFKTVEWNKPVPISARTAVIYTENLYSSVDEAVLFFDTPAYGAKYPQFSAGESARALDDMITGYLYITEELLNRFSRQGRGRLVFLLKEGFPRGEPSRPLPPGATIVPTGILAATASSAFRAFAESIALGAEEAVRVTLALTGAAQQDAEIAQWLFPYLDEDDSQKKKPRAGVNWIKYGARLQTGIPGLIQQTWSRTFSR